MTSDDLDYFQVSRVLKTKEMMRDVSGIDTFPLFTSTFLNSRGLFNSMVGYAEDYDYESRKR